jgi:hypothetical protein
MRHMRKIQPQCQQGGKLKSSLVDLGPKRKEIRWSHKPIGRKWSIHPLSHAQLPSNIYHYQYPHSTGCGSKMAQLVKSTFKLLYRRDQIHDRSGRDQICVGIKYMSGSNTHRNPMHLLTCPLFDFLDIERMLWPTSRCVVVPPALPLFPFRGPMLPCLCTIESAHAYKA